MVIVAQLAVMAVVYIHHQVLLSWVMSQMVLDSLIKSISRYSIL